MVPRGIELNRLSVLGSTVLAEGSTTDARAGVVCLDARLPVCRPLDKETNERLHLEKVRLDYLIRTGSLPFDSVERGSDPPDFRVHTATGVIGTDVSALALAERRLAYRLFDTFLDRIVASQATLGNVADTVVQVWFNFGQGLPPKRSDRDLAEQLVDTLRQVHLDRTAMEQFYAEINSKGLPQTFPTWYPIRWLPAKEAGFQVSLLPRNLAPSPLRQRIGFECVLHMTFFVDSQFVMEEIQRLVTKHDKAGIEWLALTVGAPDADGCSYPGEEVMYGLVEAESARIVANHIRRLSVHKWSTGEFLELSHRARGAAVP
jgi:hypothetical protein